MYKCELLHVQKEMMFFLNTGISVARTYLDELPTYSDAGSSAYLCPSTI